MVDGRTALTIVLAGIMLAFILAIVISAIFAIGRADEDDRYW